MNISNMFISLAILGILTTAGNAIGYHVPVIDSLIGYSFMLIITLAGALITRLSPVNLPMVFWVSIVALVATMPISPVAKLITTYTAKIDFLAICTPVLAYAGLAVGKDIDAFKKMSWKIIVVALAVYTGTFLFSSIIAEIMLRFEGII
ncbi:hypothetical protein [Sporomusa acidovorans]|uniref:DUF340 domain-containing protein n=1 Tax=Sporomusa acidovorans (strain ATCC 49682 / DSM 3132 / Mol) TaxID=1123286 RepID=A0ABZ3J2U9_SPOA4|nr:hypothetical protein [Sporomusa acidovorans]OZC23191.1 hypothetical protein SPACI_08410 [Sporomusa acidovorans DSM 3132]SDE97196.1 hypothetical protein SAMN04488499_102825 [Sporomusa acidovorans]